MPTLRFGNIPDGRQKGDQIIPPIPRRRGRRWAMPPWVCHRPWYWRETYPNEMARLAKARRWSKR
jgi:hypothetical protein